MNDEQKKQIALMRTRGIGYASIAGRLGLTKGQVASYCLRNGLAGAKGLSTPADNECYCQNCGKIILQKPKKKKRKFCCDSCCMEWWNSHPNLVHRKAIYQFTCYKCGTLFSAYGNAHRKYCSHECYIADRFGDEA